MTFYIRPQSEDLMHHGILGMKWGIRRFQNPDGSLTDAGKKRYLSPKETTEAIKKDIDIKINEKRKELSDSDEEFNRLGNELAEDYDEYYKSLAHDRRLVASLLKSLPEDISNEDEFGEEVRDKIWDDSFLMQWLPLEIKNKTGQFWEAGDRYFNTLKSISKDITEKYKNTKMLLVYNNGYKERLKVTQDRVYAIINDPKTDLGWNAYMYRHFYDYWTSDVDSRYDLENLVTFDLYKAYQKNKNLTVY